MENIFTKLFKPKANYQPLIEVRIFQDAILHNLRQYQAASPNIQFAPVLKSNAYGHGLIQVAKILDGLRLPFFMVDSFFEALSLRRAGIVTKILILGYVREKQLLENNLSNISFGIIDLEVLKKLAAKANKKINIHLKIDTGMHRQGILPDEVGEAMQLLKSNPNLILEGVCSHLADADSIVSELTGEQIKSWNKNAQKFKEHFQKIKYLHLTNTAGTYFSSQAIINVGRLGIGLYGINPSPHVKMDLHPAMEIVSIVSSLKTISSGETVGYGATYKSKADVKIATVPAGYNEGVDRRLSNQGYFKINDIFCPLVGRVSMNISSVDVTSLANIKLENEVVILSREREDKNSVENQAITCGCIPYEILVHIPQHLRRIVR